MFPFKCPHHVYISFTKTYCIPVTTLTAIINAVRILTIYLKPILPVYADKVQKFLNVESLSFGDLDAEVSRLVRLVGPLPDEELGTIKTKIAALPGQFQAALDDAVKILAPQAKTFNLPRRTITNQSDIDEYIKEIKAEVEILLKDSNSIILK